MSAKNQNHRVAIQNQLLEMELDSEESEQNLYLYDYDDESDMSYLDEDPTDIFYDGYIGLGWTYRVANE